MRPHRSHSARSPSTHAVRGRAQRGLKSLAAALLLFTLAACRAQRTLQITSEPSECEVRVDGERVGVTPLELSFEHYGSRRVSLYRPGYRTYSRLVELTPPWYGQFPFDLVFEVLIPLGWRDVHQVHANLQPGVAVLLEPDLQDILDRAERMRRAGPEGPQRRNTSAAQPAEPRP